MSEAIYSRLPDDLSWRDVVQWIGGCFVTSIDLPGSLIWVHELVDRSITGISLNTEGNFETVVLAKENIRMSWPKWGWRKMPDGRIVLAQRGSAYGWARAPRFPLITMYVPSTSKSGDHLIRPMLGTRERFLCIYQYFFPSEQAPTSPDDAYNKVISSREGEAPDLDYALQWDGRRRNVLIWWKGEVAGTILPKTQEIQYVSHRFRIKLDGVFSFKSVGG